MLTEFLKLLAPYAPHLAEELWQALGNKTEVAKETWPSYDEELTVDSEVTVVVQVNGKVRSSFVMSPDTSAEEMEKLAFEAPRIAGLVDGRTIVKVITVPHRLVNIVVA